ncbi:MAG: 2-hydroxyacyl-CoA dehydratase [Candidatus Hydrogenedentes bacterium]|nr:2-hydroxyacyl-CoA dehydratase [Candidatus Hydrogenedentota bacterium]
MKSPAKISLDAWEARRLALLNAGLEEPWYGGPLGRHLEEGDLRLQSLEFDNSTASLRLWNFLLSEEDRLQAARRQGKKIVGAMKDLGTVSVLASAAPELVSFYPDGAWWTPCLMECSDGLFAVADALGIDDRFCPVRAMIGAFETQRHFPIPDLLTCSAGATCDDFSAIAQRLEHLGHPILWWEVPYRRVPEHGEEAVELPGGWRAPVSQVQCVAQELEQVRHALEVLVDHAITEEELRNAIRDANEVRRLVNELRTLAYTSAPCPLPALEMLIIEVLPVHFCSDREECLAVLEELLKEVRRRVGNGTGVLPQEAVRIYWVNPPADLRVLNLLEECGGRICGADYMFGHARAPIPEDIRPMEALARLVLSDPMVGPAADRAAAICCEISQFGAEALVISRIPGASHCATEGEIIRHAVGQILPHLPVLEIEVPPIADALFPALRTRLQALVETVRSRGFQPRSRRQ